jgi:hypothetical protein
MKNGAGGDDDFVRVPGTSVDDPESPDSIPLTFEDLNKGEVWLGELLETFPARAFHIDKRLNNVTQDSGIPVVLKATAGGAKAVLTVHMDVRVLHTSTIEQYRELGDVYPNLEVVLDIFVPNGTTPEEGEKFKEDADKPIPPPMVCVKENNEIWYKPLDMSQLDEVIANLRKNRIRYRTEVEGKHREIDVVNLARGDNAVDRFLFPMMLPAAGKKLAHSVFTADKEHNIQQALSAWKRNLLSILSMGPASFAPITFAYLSPLLEVLSEEEFQRFFQDRFLGEALQAVYPQVELVGKDLINTVVQGLALYKWDKYKRPLYYIDPALSTMLRYTDLSNVPSEFLKLPYPAILIRPLDDFLYKLGYRDDPEPPDTETYIIAHNENRPDWSEEHLTITIFRINEKSYCKLWSIQILVSDLATLGEHSHFMGRRSWEGRDMTKEEVESLMALDEYIMSILLYIVLPEADSLLVQNSEVYRLWAEKMARKKKKGRRHEKKSGNPHSGDRRFLVGSTLKIIDRHTTETNEKGETSGRASPRMHLRQGHWHTYLVGAGRQDRTMKFVQPVFVNQRFGFDGPPKNRYKAI